MSKSGAKFDIIAISAQFMDSDTVRKIGEAVNTQVQDLLSKGISPVRGERRLEKYSESYQKWILDQKNSRVNEHVSASKARAKRGEKKAAGKVARSAALALEKMHGKSVRPVNLSLTGEMRTWLRYQKKDAMTVEYGFLKGTPKDVAVRAEVHNGGTPTTAARPMIPGEGEEWAVSIVRALKEVYSARLDAIIKKSNR